MRMLDGGFTDPRKLWGSLPSGPKQVLDPKVTPDPFESNRRRTDLEPTSRVMSSETHWDFYLGMNKYEKASHGPFIFFA